MTLLVASGTIPFFAFVSIISVKDCSCKRRCVNPPTTDHLPPTNLHRPPTSNIIYRPDFFFFFGWHTFFVESTLLYIKHFFSLAELHAKFQLLSPLKSSCLFDSLFHTFIITFFNFSNFTADSWRFFPFLIGFFVVGELCT